MAASDLEQNARAWRARYGSAPDWAAPCSDARTPPIDPAALNSVPAAAPALILIGADLLQLLPADAHAWPRHVIVFEPRRAVAHAVMAAHDWASALSSGSLAVFTGPAYTGATAVAREAGTLAAAPVVASPTLHAEAPAEVARARTLITSVVFGQSANDGARKASAARYLLQTLANAPRLAREAPIDALAGLFPGIPAIVVAAGPSLDRNVHDLAPVLDRALVIACDTAARPLINAGVEPDFIVATDGSRANAAHLSSLPPSRSWLVAEGGLHPSAFVHADGRTWYFRVADHEPWPWLRRAGIDAAVLGTWGSVATSAFSLALELGCAPIVFAGADFAFTDSRPYCRGTSFESLWGSWIAGGATYDAVWRVLVDRWPVVHEADVRGMTTRTAPHLVAFRNWIVERTGAATDRVIVNATDAGILSGPGITQQSAVHTLKHAPVLNRAAVHETIRHARSRAPHGMTRLLVAATEWLTADVPPELAAWTAFCDGGVTREAIAAALESPEFAAWRAALTAMHAPAAHAS